MYKTMSHLFEILIFSQDIWGNVHYVRKIKLILEGTLIKAFYIPKIIIIIKKSETRFFRRKTAEDNNAKIIPAYTLYPFALQS